VINAVRSVEVPASLAGGQRYNAQDVVDALLRDFRGKCYLCECPISVRQHSIDHRRPQAQFPALVFEWTNRFPSCRDCNERRPAYPVEGLLDPTRDDVEGRLSQTVRRDLTRNADAPTFGALDPADACGVATARELDHLHNSRSIKAAELRDAIRQRVDEILEHILEIRMHGESVRGPVRAAFEAPLRVGFSRNSPFTALVRGRLGAGLEHLFD
jgi:uncharacterized protein (TIGR02646 family)